MPGARPRGRPPKDPAANAALYNEKLLKRTARQAAQAAAAAALSGGFACTFFHRYLGVWCAAVHGGCALGGFASSHDAALALLAHLRGQPPPPPPPRAAEAAARLAHAESDDDVVQVGVVGGAEAGAAAAAAVAEWVCDLVTAVENGWKSIRHLRRRSVGAPKATRRPRRRRESRGRPAPAPTPRAAAWARRRTASMSRRPA